ncbi:hypothetical protein CDL23_13415 [Mediterraneibacter gnavus]|uniref:Uncharacterized protein n=1 Tax=Mediterraneibacter gnavus TaxID=33038 RepID=A0A2N5PB40_MEDGN|nr:hypothetical protein CDL23_13415 [Mediterraneibacter gnavus]
MNNKTKNRPTATNTGTAIHIRRYAIKIQEYCIIFGNSLQAEHLFMCWLLFLYLFLHKLNEEMI